MANFKQKKRLYLLNGRTHHFIHSQWAGGTVLFICAVAAIFFANWHITADGFRHFWEQRLTIGLEDFNLSKTLEEWINDGLMVLFFFVVGLEIKREVIAGQLSSIRQAGLPIAAALGGMLFPALIYLSFNRGTIYEPGWGIPTATDIAFALGVLSLLGKRIPLSLKIFLTALAIVDDLGAILVIAIFYSAQIHWVVLAAALGTFVLLLILNRLKVFRMRYYLLPAILLWLLFLHSGIHATIAGVIIAMAIPSDARFSKKYFLYKGNNLLRTFAYEDQPGMGMLSNEKQQAAARSLWKIARRTIPPSLQLEYALHSTIAFFVMPVFALANAGVVVDLSQVSTLVNSESVGVFLGLVVGKPFGIFLFSLIAIRAGWCVMPTGATWGTLFAVACLGGIGFTMSMFINNLAFADPAMVATGKVSILLGSCTAALLGWAVMALTRRSHLHEKPGPRIP
ncbi:MAG: Na+/H+ antiporter NhaA [Rikenellaceae bacterium]|jgi:NhaA family Na+:H+ antiporter|nr:Na+/H+ antiporter NhaA [Rikenellaceae bacterium]